MRSNFRVLVSSLSSSPAARARRRAVDLRRRPARRRRRARRASRSGILDRASARRRAGPGRRGGCGAERTAGAPRPFDARYRAVAGDACGFASKPPDRRSLEPSAQRSVRQPGRRDQRGAARCARGEPRPRCDPARTGDPLWDGRAARGPANVSDAPARVQLAAKYEYRPLSGKRAVPRRARRDRAHERGRRVVVRRQQLVRGLDRKASRRRRARPSRSSTTVARRPTSSSRARRRTRCSRPNDPACPSCSSTWACACRCLTTGLPTSR